ncbi:MAG: hypothetical protein WBW49_09795, partial [Candidatus Acidiferrum sp.]
MEATNRSEDAKAEYSSRLQSATIQRSNHEQSHKRLGIAKLGILFLVVVLLAWYLKSKAVSPLWLIVPAIAFVFLEVEHSRVLGSMRRCSGLMAFYERGLARLNNEWAGTGEPGDVFLDPAHPYARDLDLFGKGSLFELLCTARTSAGQEILAEWLKRAASLEEIASRQAAVMELRPRLNLRAELANFGQGIRSEVRPNALMAWAEAAPVLQPRRARIVALLFCVLWLSTIVIWAFSGLWQFVLLIAAVNLVVNWRFKPYVTEIISAEKFENDLTLLAGALALFEQESFSSARLVELKSELRAAGALPSHSIARVRRLIESLESRRNLALNAIDPFILWSAQLAFAIEVWRQKFGASVRHWLAAVGEMEALMSLAGYAYEHPADIFPEFIEGNALFEVEGLTHPLLPESRAVANDLKLGGEPRLMIVSGPNMAGKSTLIRAVGINGVLAQSGAPVRARKLRMSRLQVAASI